jgi:hypothetical protein
MLFRKHVDIDGESVIAGRHFRAAWSSAAMQDRHALDGAKTRLAALKKYDRRYRQTQEACVLVVARSASSPPDATSRARARCRHTSLVALDP